MQLSLLYKDIDSIHSPPIAGGVQKRFQAFYRYLLRANKLNNLYSYEDIDKISSSEFVVGYNLDNEICRKLGDLNINTCNTYCSGHDQPSEIIFTSNTVSARFLSPSHFELCKNFVDNKRAFTAPHGFNSEEFSSLNSDPKYFIWCSSLAWGPYAKGLSQFIKMAIKNPSYNFVAYGGSRNNSEKLERDLQKLDDELNNFQFKANLEDEDKDAAFSKAIALCQFTLLNESFNVVTLESIFRKVPVLTLPVNNGGVSDNLGDFNICIEELLVNDQLLAEINKQKNRLNNNEFDFMRFSCETEYETIKNHFESQKQTTRFTCGNAPWNHYAAFKKHK